VTKVTVLKANFR